GRGGGVGAYGEALKEQPGGGVPLQWAMTQKDLGNALSLLGERESGTAKLEEAVVAFREALKEGTRQRAPLQWAAVVGGEGMALMVIAERRGGVGLAERGVRPSHTAIQAARGGGAAPK